MRRHLLASLAAALFALPALARDFNYTYEGQTITYTVIDEAAKTCKTKSGEYFNPSNNISGNLMLPSKVYDGSNNYTLVEIGVYSFCCCSNLTSVTIPISVTVIGDNAFFNCPGITSVTIPNSVITIGNQSFWCCSGLTSVTIGNSVTEIGGYAFGGCPGLTSITIPNSVTSIGYQAFSRCDGLTSVTIPNSVTNIGEGIFAYCDNLTAINVDHANSYYTAQNGILYSKDMTKLFQYPAGKTQQTFDIPNSVTIIGYSAFGGCCSLTSVSIPNSVTAIGDDAFEGCHGLTSITIPNSITEINSGTFLYCYGLTSVTIPNSVTKIQGWAFSYCSGLTSVTIGNSVTEICQQVFYNCTNLETVEVLAVTPPSCEDAKVFDDDTYSNAVLKVPANSVEAYKSADVWRQFANIVSLGGGNPDDDMNDVTFPDWQSTNHSDNSTSEKEYSFSVVAGNVLTFNYAVDSEENCDKLIVKINNVEVLTKSGNQTGHYSKKFSADGNVTLTLSYTKDYSVSHGEDCAWVTDIILHKQPFEELPFVGKEFDYTYEGQTVTYIITDLEAKTCKTKDGNWNNPGNNISGDLILPSTVYDGSDNYTLVEIGDYSFKNCGLTSVSIPNSLVSIGQYAFRECSGLTSVNIPNSVTTIGYEAFGYCYSLSSVTFGNSIAEIGGYAFACCNITSVTLPNSVTTIGEGAFWDCQDLTSAYIHNFITNIGDGVFANCLNLTAIDVDPGNSYYTAQNGILYSKDMTKLIQYPAGKAQQTFDIPNSVATIGADAFTGCRGLTSITIPNSVTEIGWSAFSSCSGLTSISIPNSITEIKDWAFGHCSGLTSIVIPDSVATIGDSAFYGCSGLTSVTIGNSVTEIGERAFDDCPSLKTVEVLALTPPSCINTTVFDDDIYSNAVLKVPANSVDAYKSADVWRQFANIVGIEGLITTSINGLNYFLNSQDMTATVTFSAQNSLSNYEGLLNINIPATVEYEGGSYTVTAIGQEAFNNCWGLKAVSLPGTLQSIDKLAFGYCTSLRSAIIPDNVTIIDDEAFTGCSALASVSIGNSVETIGDYAFFGCTGLAAIHVPESVKSIGENAFMGIHWIDEVRVESSTPAMAPVSAFSINAYKSATLVVPDNAVESYKAHPTWSNFTKIIGKSHLQTKIDVEDGVIVVKGSDNVRVYNTSGVQVYIGESSRIELPSGTYLVVTDKVTKKVRI